MAFAYRSGKLALSPAGSIKGVCGNITAGLFTDDLGIRLSEVAGSPTRQGRGTLLLVTIKILAEVMLSGGNRLSRLQ